MPLIIQYHNAKTQALTFLLFFIIVKYYRQGPVSLNTSKNSGHSQKCKTSNKSHQRRWGMHFFNMEKRSNFNRKWSKCFQCWPFNCIFSAKWILEGSVYMKKSHLKVRLNVNIWLCLKVIVTDDRLSVENLCCLIGVKQLIQLENYTTTRGWCADF